MITVSRKLKRDLFVAGVFVTAVVMCLAVSGCGGDSNPAASVDARAFSDKVEQTFPVDNLAHIDLRNFVGNVTVTPSGTPLVHVTATKYASRQEDLDKISLAMSAANNNVSIVATNPTNTQHVLVDMDITAPEIATWELYTNVGSIDYEGRPSGQCSFTTDVGSIDLTWPSNLNADINVSANVGTVTILIPFDGLVSINSAVGTIGNGSEANIAVSTGVGAITIKN